MKIKITEKQIKEGFKNIICVGYCDLQHLLSCKEPDFYTCGVYGWKADFYKINNNTIISTGYAPTGNIRNYKINKKYEDKAYKIDHDWNTPYEKRTKKLEKLLQKYVNEILKKEEEE